MLLKPQNVFRLYSKPFGRKKFWGFCKPLLDTRIVAISPLHITDIPSRLRWQLLSSVTKEINLDWDIRPLVVM